MATRTWKIEHIIRYYPNYTILELGKNICIRCPNCKLILIQGSVNKVHKFIFNY